MQQNTSNSVILQEVGRKTVAVVDDEADIVELVSVNLQKHGFIVREFYDGNSFLQYLKTETPDLAVLDLMLPDTDGMELCKFIRRHEETANIPVIILTAKGDETDKILGFELGADDYITKPFSPREFIARVKAVLRREGKQFKTKIINIGDLIQIDTQKHEVFISGSKIYLTATEYKILSFISEKIGWAYSREQILEHLGVQDKGVLDRTVDVHIKNLREKLGVDAGKLIKNIRGFGYKIEQK